ncbi:MAG: hypothetical protein OXC60_21110 [Litoreibacter sp.]|nr:hypothetical protein [Litoreibacter sp.]MCY4337156.1 hypothetical protein [Litoreibacter sp.]
MGRRLLSIFLALTVSLGIVLPKAGGVLLELMPGFTQAVICTGSEIVVITLDAKGDPVELPEPAVEHCVLDNVVAALSTPAPTWVKLRPQFETAFVSVSVRAPAAHLGLLPPGQGPPRAA